MISHYNIHDLVTVRIERPGHFLRDAISNPDQYFKTFITDQVIDPDVTVHLGPFDADLSGCFAVDNKYQVKENYLYFQDRYKTATWKAQVSGFETGKITIRLDCNLFGLIFTMGLIELFIRYLLVLKGYAFIHAFGIVHNGRGVLFPARSGVGKTVSTIYFLEDGYFLLSDNFVIVKDKTMYAYPTPMNIFSYNLKGPLKKRIPKLVRLAIWSKELLYRATAGYAKFLTPIQIDEAFPGQIVKQAEIHDIIFTVVGDSFGVTENIDKGVLPPRFTAINQFESLYYLKLIESYKLIFPRGKLSGHWERLHKVFQNAVSQVPCSELRVPPDYTREVYEKIKAFSFTM